MPEMQLHRFVEDGRRVFRLLGAFDGDAAQQLLDRLRREQPEEIMIDVALLRGLDEVGLAALARLASGGGRHRIALRGLSAHQLRILRYLGAALSGLQRRGAQERTA